MPLSMMSAFKLGRYSAAMVASNCRPTTAHNHREYGRRKVRSRRISMVSRMPLSADTTRTRCWYCAERERAPSTPAVDDREHVTEALHDRVRLAGHRADLLGRDDAVRDEDRAHAHRLRAVDVVEDPVADEHRGGRVVDPDGVERGVEGLRMRLGPRDLRRVHGAVDEAERAVTLEDL